MTIKRREFIPLFLAALFLRFRVSATEIKNGRVILSASVNQKYFIYNFDEKTVFTIPNDFPVHSFLTLDEQFYLAIEKGKNLSVVSKIENKIIKKIVAPENLMFYGHGVASEDHIVFSAGNSKLKDGKVVPDHKYSGSLLVYDKKSFELINQIPGTGHQNHQIVYHDGLLYLGSYNKSEERPVLKVFDSNYKLVKEENFNDVGKKLSVRHMQSRNGMLIIIMDKLNSKGDVVSGAIATYEKNSAPKVFKFPKIKDNKELEHVSFVIDNEKLYLQMYNIYSTLCFDLVSKKYEIIENAPNSYAQILFLINLKYPRYAKEDFLKKHLNVSEHNFYVNSHLYFPS